MVTTRFLAELLHYILLNTAKTSPLPSLLCWTSSLHTPYCWIYSLHSLSAKELLHYVHNTVTGLSICVCLSVCPGTWPHDFIYPHRQTDTHRQAILFVRLVSAPRVAWAKVAGGGKTQHCLALDNASYLTLSGIHIARYPALSGNAAWVKVCGVFQYQPLSVTQHYPVHWPIQQRLIYIALHPHYIHAILLNNFTTDCLYCILNSENQNNLYYF